MKTGFKKSLALLLAVFMAFGATPFALGFAVFAEDTAPDAPDAPVYVLKALSVSPDVATKAVGETLTLSVSGAFVNTADPTDITSKAIRNTDVDWSSSDTKLATVSSEGVVTALAVCEEVIIKAADKNDGNIKGVCKIKIEKAPVTVDSITWNWKANALLAGNTFKLTSDMYTIVPEKPDNTEVELTWSPASAIQLLEDGSYKVNDLPKGETSLTVTLTLTAKGAGKDCKPADKQMKILSDVPLTEVKWNYRVNEKGQTLFKYYDNTTGTIKNKNFHPYKYTAYSNGVALDASALSLCDVKITSADNRVVRPDDKCQNFIPVGNGQANITVTVKTPKGVTRSHTITVVVQDSPYTPITIAGIGYDEKNTDSNASYDPATNTISLMYTHGIQLTAKLNDKATLEQKAITITTEDGRKDTIVKECEYKWTSSNEAVATVDKTTGKVTCVGIGDAVITLYINDGGTEFTKTINVKGSMSWWEALVGILMSIISFNFNKVPTYFKALFSAIF